MIPLPDDLFQAALCIGFFAADHESMPAQAEALRQLRQSLSGGDVTCVVNALRCVAREFRCDVSGKHLPERINGTRRKALMLIDQIEGAAQLERAA